MKYNGSENNKELQIQCNNQTSLFSANWGTGYRSSVVKIVLNLTDVIAGTSCSEACLMSKPYGKYQWLVID